MNGFIGTVRGDVYGVRGAGGRRSVFRALWGLSKTPSWVSLLDPKGFKVLLREVPFALNIHANDRLLDGRGQTHPPDIELATAAHDPFDVGRVPPCGSAPSLVTRFSALGVVYLDDLPKIVAKQAQKKDASPGICQSPVVAGTPTSHWGRRLLC